MADRTWWKRAILWEVPFLAALGAFMFWVRMLPYKALVGSGRAYFIGTDPFYHFRETLGAVRAFPRVPRFDPWTNYPFGTTTGQFGSLFDLLAAAYVVVMAGRDASEQYVGEVLGAYPAVLGALLIVPFYYLAKRLLGIPGAIVATITIALLPGEFLIRSIAAYSDHHVMEALLALVSILGVYVAATRAQAARDRLVEPRGFVDVRGPLPWALLGGVGLALYFYAWPPAILFLAILTVWLTVVILIEDGAGGDARGYAYGGAVSFAVAGLLMVPAIETTVLGEFNTYGILHPIASLLAALWLVGVHFAARWTKGRGWSPWVVPGIVVAGALASYLVVVLFLSQLYSSVLWGLSWITGFGVQRTMTTIAEAREASFFCSTDTSEYSCLASDFGAAAPLSVLILVGLFVHVLWKRRPSDILLLIWSLVVFRATSTQIRFSYYLALNVALLIGWLAARVAEWTGLEAALTGATATAPAKPARGRKTRRVEARTRSATWWQVAAVAAVLILVMPGNVFATDNARPAWKSARITAPDNDLVLWMDGLDWMRTHTPDAGVDLAAIVEAPPYGTIFDYPPQTYGVLTWWDYGHWIETIAQRPPVANPFQQAAPFAALYFTERDPAAAERMLDERVGNEGPIRYVFIDDAIATGKFGAITVWANSQNASRAQWAGGEYVEQRQYTSPGGGARPLYTWGPEYRESMMGRLYDDDGNGLSNYRLVWEHPSYTGIGNVANTEGGVQCLHDAVPSGGCYVIFDTNLIQSYQPGTVLDIGDGRIAYDLSAVSRLKLFERVEGARLVGTALPGAAVTAGVRVVVEQDDGQVARSFTHSVTTTAGPDGRFELVFPYATSGFLGPQDGGTDVAAKPQGVVIVTSPGSGNARVDVTETAVLKGEAVPVTFDA